MEYAEPLKQVGVFALAAMWLTATYRFADKWFGKFLDVQTKQADALARLSLTVDQSNGEHREGVIVMRAIGDQTDRMRDEIVGMREDVAALCGEVRGLRGGKH